MVPLLSPGFAMGPEAKIERYLGLRVRALGGWSIKMAPTVAGVPDRLVMLPGGAIYLVELKSARGGMRKVQRVWHDRARRMGHSPVVLSSKTQVDQWLDSVTNATPL